MWKVQIKSSFYLFLFKNMRYADLMGYQEALFYLNYDFSFLFLTSLENDFQFTV